jgi:phosphoribosyl-ATP pyrophosphohydrolase
MTDSLRRLHDAVRDSRNADPAVSRTARLLRAGPAKISKKVAEEAVEVALAAMANDRKEVVRESADLLYNLVVLWVEAGVPPKDVWAEMERREKLLGIAEKLPKAPARKSVRQIERPQAARKRGQRVR